MVIFGVNGGLDGVSWCISWLQIPGTCPDPPNPALSMPTAPPTFVLLLLVLSVASPTPHQPTIPRPGCPRSLSWWSWWQQTFLWWSKWSCGRRGGAYGGRVVWRSASVQAATDRSRNRNKGTQDTVMHLSHTLGDRPHPEHFPRTIHPLPYVPNRCPHADTFETRLVADSKRKVGGWRGGKRAGSALVMQTSRAVVVPSHERCSETPWG